jgi:hypothetical protein
MEYAAVPPRFAVSLPVIHFQVRVSFPGGGRMTFGVKADSEQEARDAAELRLRGLPDAEVEVVLLVPAVGR